MNGYYIVGAEHIGRSEEDVRALLPSLLPLDLASRTFRAGDILLGMGCVLFERYNDEHLHRVAQNKEHDVIFFYGDLLQAVNMNSAATYVQYIYRERERER